MKADGIDERILKDTKTGRQLHCLLMLTVSVTPLLSIPLFQSDREGDEERILYGGNPTLGVSIVQLPFNHQSSSSPSFPKLHSLIERL